MEEGYGLSSTVILTFASSRSYVVWLPFFLLGSEIEDQLRHLHLDQNVIDQVQKCTVTK